MRIELKINIRISLTSKSFDSGPLPKVSHNEMTTNESFEAVPTCSEQCTNAQSTKCVPLQEPFTFPNVCLPTQSLEEKFFHLKRLRMTQTL